MGQPFVVIVEFSSCKDGTETKQVHVYHSVYEKSAGEAMNRIQGYFDLYFPGELITKMSAGQTPTFKVRDWDAIRPMSPY